MADHFGIGTSVSLPFDDAVQRTREALAAEGFGVLSEIDLQAKLKEKLGVEMNRYLILGACNPPLAHKALQAELEIGLLLPCNVIVYETAAKEVVVAAVDPDAMLSVVPGSAAVAEVARDAKKRLTAAIEALARA